MAALPHYALYAIRYGSVRRKQSELFWGGDPHDGPGGLDFFVWAAVSGERAVVIDTGFDAEEAARRDREIARCPVEALALVGLDGAQVEDVVITHMHYDHAGNLGKFGRARFHLQDTEMHYATGRHMCHTPMGFAYSAEHAVAMVRHVYAGRVAFHDGDAEIAPGLSLHHLGGHTMGLQVVRVHTARGWVVVASDATHLYANMLEGRPFPIVYDMGRVFEAYARLHSLADSTDHIVPGHDPLVMAHYPAPAPELEGIVARLDVAPRRLG